MWAEPCLIAAAKEEYDGVIEEFLATGEKLFGPYVWGRCGITWTLVSVVTVSRPSPLPGPDPGGVGAGGGDKPGLIRCGQGGAWEGRHCGDRGVPVPAVAGVEMGMRCRGRG